MRGGFAAGAAITRIVGRRLQAGRRADAALAPVDGGIEQFGKRRRDRLHVGPMRFRFGGSGRLFRSVGGLRHGAKYGSDAPDMKGAKAAALRTIRELRLRATNEAGRCQQLAVALRVTLTSLASCDDTESDIDMVEPRQADMEQGAGCCSMPGGRLDDIEMDAVASRTLQRPVFGTGATGDHAQDDQRCITLRASRANRRSHLPGNRLRHGNGPHSNKLRASFSV